MLICVIIDIDKYYIAYTFSLMEMPCYVVAYRIGSINFPKFTWSLRKLSSSLSYVNECCLLCGYVLFYFRYCSGWQRINPVTTVCAVRLLGVWRLMGTAAAPSYRVKGIVKRCVPWFRKGSVAWHEHEFCF